MKKFIIILLLGVASSACFAQEDVGLQDKIIASTFKTLARTFVAAVDIEKLKEVNAAKINKMDEEKFDKRYAAAYKIIKDLPPDVKTHYGVFEVMTKKWAIANMRLLDKKRIYALIDEVPDKIIAGQFKTYIMKQKTELQDVDLMGRIQEFWQRIIEKTGP